MSLFLAESIIKDYEGGDNPLLIILTVIFFISLFVAFLVYVTWSAYCRYKVEQLLTNGNYTGDELGLIKSCIARLRVNDPIQLLTKRSHFDKFSNRISHLYEVSDLSLNEIGREADILRGIRAKLSFLHSFSNYPLGSSRGVPVSYVISVTFQFPEGNTYYSWYAKVMDNSEFFLGISPPPDRAVRDEIKGTSKLSLDISFARKSDAEYHFHSHLVRITPSPKSMWLVAHSEGLERRDLLKPMRLPGIILCSKFVEEPEKTMEIPIRIAGINNQQCFFELVEPKKLLINEETVLLSFSLKEKTFSCQAHVQEIYDRGSTLIYQVGFASLDEETNQFLINFQLQLRLRQQQKKLKAAGK